MNELKACPFCGKTEKVRGGNGAGWCENCFAIYDGYAENWNSRPLEDALREEIAHLEKIIETKNQMLETYQGSCRLDQEE